MKKVLTIALILCSIGVSAQNVPKGATTAELKPEIAKYLSTYDNSIMLWDSSKSDTVAIYMLTTFKYANGMVPVRQTKGYSVTPRMAYNSSPRATYLDIDKKPLQDIYIVWMSVPRKEECTCK